MKSVRTKISALVLCFVILSSAAIGSASIINSRRVVREDSTHIMNLLCENRSDELDVLLSRIEQSVNTLYLYASGLVTDSSSLFSDPSHTEEYIQKLKDIAVISAQNTKGAKTVYIRFNPKLADPSSGFFYGLNEETGKFQALEPTDLSLYDQDDTSHVGWFYEPVRAGRAIWLMPYRNNNIDMDIISYTIPYYKDGILIGVVGMDIDYRVIQNVAAQTNIYQTGYAFLTDDDARILYHYALGKGTDLSAFNGGEFKAMAEQLKDNQSNGDSLILYTYEGVQKKAAFLVLRNNMRLVLTAPTYEIDAQADKLIIQICIVFLTVVAIAIFLSILFTRRFVRPLQELTKASQKIAAGDLSVEITHRSSDEIGILAESFRKTASHLRKYISELNEYAHKDSLTGVSNKTAYMEAVWQLDFQAEKPNFQYAVVVFDINGLKQINDTKGHDYGDLLISNACGIIHKTFSNSVTYRIGGDEFAVLLTKEGYKNRISSLDEFHQNLAEYNLNPQNGTAVSIAVGLSEYISQTDTCFNDVFRRADGAMYKDKERNKHLK